MNIPIGIANSVSSNFGYDPLDALRFAQQSKFDLLQVYLNENLIRESAELRNIFHEIKQNTSCKILIHADGFLNKEWLQSEYSKKLFDMLCEQNIRTFIIHFDEKASLDEMLKIVEELANKDLTIYLENYFQGGGIQNAEKNLKKFMALFTLSNSHGHSLRILPVIDIPRFFHQKLEFDLNDSLRWCYQIFNYFGNKKMPMIFHFIDAKDAAQYRTSYCAIGEGYIPYLKIFSFLKKNRYRISGIILEFEDKINTLKSRENLLNIFKF